MVATSITARVVLNCKQCMAYYNSDANKTLPMAAASVGIEHGKSTQRMLLEYLAGYHRRGHIE